MYAELLMTPHQKKMSSNDTLIPLMEKLELHVLAEQLQNVQGVSSELYDSTAAEIANVVSKEVGEALWFPVQYGKRDDFEEYNVEFPIELASLESQQMADCFGYTYVTSEILSMCSIDHWISYANGHTFIIIPPSKRDSASSSEIYMVDAVPPSLNQYMKGAFVVGSVPKIDKEIRESKRAVTMIDTDKIARNAGYTHQEAAGKHKWLFHRGDNRSSTDKIYVNGDESKEYSRFLSRKRIIMSSYPAELGRYVIEQYSKLRSATEQQDTDVALEAVESMIGIYPEVDARQKHDELNAIVDSLCERGDIATAVMAVDSYFDDNFAISRDSRIPEAKGDIFYKIYKYSPEDWIRDKSVEAYRLASMRPRCFKERILAKFATLQSL